MITVNTIERCDLYILETPYNIPRDFRTFTTCINFFLNIMLSTDRDYFIMYDNFSQII